MADYIRDFAMGKKIRQRYYDRNANPRLRNVSLAKANAFTHWLQWSTDDGTCYNIPLWSFRQDIVTIITENYATPLYVNVLNTTKRKQFNTICKDFIYAGNNFLLQDVELPDGKMCYGSPGLILDGGFKPLFMLSACIPKEEYHEKTIPTAHLKVYVDKKCLPAQEFLTKCIMTKLLPLYATFKGARSFYTPCTLKNFYIEYSNPEIHIGNLSKYYYQPSFVDEGEDMDKNIKDFLLRNYG